VTVAQTALWIAELKMKRETEEIVHKAHCVVVGMADKNLNVDKKSLTAIKFSTRQISIRISSTPRPFSSRAEQSLFINNELRYCFWIILGFNRAGRDGLSLRDINKLNTYGVDTSNRWAIEF